MNDELRNLMITEPEMYEANGLGDVLRRISEYRGGLSRSVDEGLNFLASIASIVLLLMAGGIAAMAGLYFLRGAEFPLFLVLPITAAVGFGGALLCRRWIDYHGRYILGKYGPEAHARYLSYKNPQRMQRKLFAEVERFNKLVRAIHVSDEIHAVGIPGAQIQDRAALLNCMTLARADLMRALKLERILRENADIASPEFSLFNIDLTQAAAMQVEGAATQQGKLMNEAFQIARSVQAEVRELQTRDREMAR